MLQYWLQHHKLPAKASMAPLLFLGQDNWNKVQCDFLGDMMPLVPVLASHDADGIINETTMFPRSRQTNEVQYDFWSCDSIGTIHFLGQDNHGVTCPYDTTDTTVTWCWQHHQWNHCISQVKAIKRGAIWLFWSCDAIGTIHFLGQDNENVIQHDNMTPLTLPSHDADGIINGTITFLSLRYSKRGATWPFWSCDAPGTNGVINATTAFLR